MTSIAISSSQAAALIWPATRRAFTERRGPCFEIAVRQRADAGFEFADLRDDRAQTFQLSFVLRSYDLREEGIEHLTTRSPDDATRRRAVGQGSPSILIQERKSEDRS